MLTAKASKESVYQEAAFFHKPTKSLLLCDAVVSTGIDPPEILLSEPEYRRALLYHARDDPLEKVLGVELGVGLELGVRGRGRG